MSTDGAGRDRSSLSRRGFLTAVGGALVALAGACSSKSSGSAAGRTSTGVRANGLDAGVLSIEPYVSAAPERFAFTLENDNGGFAAGPDCTLSLRPPGGAPGPAVATALHADGLPKGRGVYVVDTPLTPAGIWAGVVRIPGHPDAELHFEVTATPQVPIVGGAALHTPSPTITNTMGVNPLCTRQPACDLHTVSLDTAIASGKPVAVMFATPARCQSRYCGPVLDQLLSVQDAYSGRVTMIHVEIYKDSTSNDLVPTVAQWNLPGEPWLFGIDRTGRIAGRLDGAFGTDEVRALLDRIAA